MRKSKVLRAFRAAREDRQFWRTVETAPPSMQRELIAAAARSLPR